MNRDEFLKKLHPAITHINASDEMSEETLQAINVMVEKVMQMTHEQRRELNLPQEIKDAKKYISDCESDIGFMGSLEYYKKKKMVYDYYCKTP